MAQAMFTALDWGCAECSGQPMTDADRLQARAIKTGCSTTQVTARFDCGPGHQHPWQQYQGKPAAGTSSAPGAAQGDTSGLLQIRPDWLLDPTQLDGPHSTLHRQAHRERCL